MPALQQVLAQLLKVVNLPVEDDPDGSVLVANRLMPRVEIDDAQAPHAKPHRTVHVDACIVRTAMPDRPAHASDQIGVHRPVSLKTQLAANTTHRPSDSRPR